jgi:hypothetical protein
MYQRREQVIYNFVGLLFKDCRMHFSLRMSALQYPPPQGSYVDGLNVLCILEFVAMDVYCMRLPLVKYCIDQMTKDPSGQSSHVYCRSIQREKCMIEWYCTVMRTSFSLLRGRRPNLRLISSSATHPHGQRPHISLRSFQMPLIVYHLTPNPSQSLTGHYAPNVLSTPRRIMCSRER